MAGRRLRFPLLAAVTLVTACGKPPDEPISDVRLKPTTIDLSDGMTDPRLFGSWKNPEEAYTFLKDGTFHLHFDRMEQVGPSKSSKVRKTGDLSGKWSATKDYLLLSVEHGENAKHKMILLVRDADRTMELRPTFLKKGPGTIYHRVASR